MFAIALVTFVAGADPAPGTITAYAGTGEKGFAGDGGSANKAQLNQPFDVALDRAGNLYFSDTFNHRIRGVDLKSGVIATLAGNGKKVSAGDGGPYKDAAFAGPRAVAVGPDGSLYVVEREGNGVRRIDLAAGTITRFAGTGRKGYTG